MNHLPHDGRVQRTRKTPVDSSLASITIRLHALQRIGITVTPKMKERAGSPFGDGDGYAPARTENLHI